MVTAYLQDPDVTLWHGDALSILRELPDGAADACVTSPPYFDSRPEYPSPTINDWDAILGELRRVVRGSLLLNLGRKWKDGREWRWYEEIVSLAESAGWPHVDTRIWVKPNSNPILGRVLADSHEYIFMFGDGFDPDSVRTEYAESSVSRMNRKWLHGNGVKGGIRAQDGRDLNEAGARPRSIMVGYVGEEKGLEHPAPMPISIAEELVKLSGGSTILDPFVGGGTTCLAARRLGKRSVGIDLNESYLELAARRLQQQSLFAVES